MKKFHLIYLIGVHLLLKSSFSFAQYNQTIRTGRPGQAIGVFTVGKKILQLQQGVDYHGQINNSSKPQSLISNNVIRYGIKETIELSALVDYQGDSYQVKDTIYTYNGLSNHILALELI